MFIHSVYFWLREDLSEQELREFQQGLDSLTKIPDVKQSFIGTPAATDSVSYRPKLLLRTDTVFR